jgi:general secretion pathway protein G
MSIETCKNCKRIIGELEQAYIWQSHILCKECYARLSNHTVEQPTPVEVHLPVIIPHPQRSLVKSTIIVMATVIAVIVVISIVLFIPPTLSSYYEKIQYIPVSITKANLKTLHIAVLQFYADTGRYPTEEEGLIVLVEQPADVGNWDSEGYLEQTEIPKDAWNHEFKYERFPESGKQFVIRSAGPDGEAGTDDDLLSTDAD